MPSKTEPAIKKNKKDKINCSKNVSKPKLTRKHKGKLPKVENKAKGLKSKLKKWCNYPEINPYTDEPIKVSVVSNSEYVKLYKSFLEYLVSVNEPNITSKLPTTHCYSFTSTAIDLSFYKRNGKEVKLKTFNFYSSALKCVNLEFFCIFTF